MHMYSVTKMTTIDILKVGELSMSDIILVSLAELS